MEPHGLLVVVADVVVVVDAIAVCLLFRRVFVVPVHLAIVNAAECITTAYTANLSAHQAVVRNAPVVPEKAECRERKAPKSTVFFWKAHSAARARQHLCQRASLV